MFIEPNPEQIRTLLADGRSGPVTMLNLLKYKPDGGEAAYLHYGEGVLPILARIGAHIVWQGSADSVVIGGEVSDDWDAVVLVQYPSRQAFIDMVTSADYQAVADRRTQALADSRLIACTEQFRAPVA